MKYLLASLSLSLFSFLFKGADIPVNQIPEVIQTAFNNQFSNAVDIEWEKSRSNNYEVEFKIDRMDYKAEFSNTAELIRYKHENSIKDLPEKISGVLANSFSGYVVEDAEKLMIENSIYYQIELEGRILDKNLVFNEEGTEVKKIDFWD